MLFVMAFIAFLELYIILIDIKKYKGLDRIDAMNNSIELSGLNKKLIFFALFISI